MCRMLDVLSRPGRTAGPRNSSYLLKFTHTSAGFSGCFWSGTKYVLTRSRSTVGMLILLVLVCIEVFFWRGSEHGGRAFNRMKAFDEKPTVAEVVSSGIAQRVAASANHYNLHSPPRKLQQLLDRSTVHILPRWLGFARPSVRRSPSTSARLIPSHRQCALPSTALGCI